MREWPESWKNSLRYLAAARFYLPEDLKTSEFGTDALYLEYLHHREYELALDELAAIGIENSGFGQEDLFWRELELAAENMGRLEQAAEFRGRANNSSGTTDA